MPKTNKRQIGFYADRDVEQFLDSLDPGVKTRTINAALRAWMESRSIIEAPNAYDDKLDSLAAWLNGLKPPITVNNQDGSVVSLGALLERFLNQERQRQSNKSWWQLAAEGATFEAPTTRCALCNKALLVSEVINTPSRGPLCRQCFEIPPGRIRPTGTPEHGDFERYAYDAAEDWMKLHGQLDLERHFSDESYEELPRYVQKQITYDQYHEIVLRCLAQLRKTRRR